MKNKFVMVGNYIIDVVLSEEHTFEADVTDYPVEDGGSFSDNIRPKPVRLVIEGLITNTPLTSNLSAGSQLVDGKRPAVFSDNSSLFEGFTPATGSLLSQATTTVKHLRSDQAYNFLRGISLSRDTVPVRTSLGLFENMALVTLTTPRDANTGDALRFSATFQQIQKVTNTRLKSSDGKKRRGQGSTTPVPSPKILWKRGIIAGQLPIFDTRYVEYRLNQVTKAPELWYSVQPISIAQINFGTGGAFLYTGTPGPRYLSNTGGQENRLLDAVELAAFKLDMNRDRKAERERQLEAGLNLDSMSRNRRARDLAMTGNDQLTKRSLLDYSEENRNVLKRQGSEGHPLTDKLRSGGAPVQDSPLAAPKSPFESGL